LYFSSWIALVFLMIVGAIRAPGTLYTELDGEWARWNARAILHFGRFLDFGPHNILAGMGSTYFANLPWLNPGALALLLPFSYTVTNVISYIVYGVELAVSIYAIARAFGFSRLVATISAQMHLLLFFPPFSVAFQIFPFYSNIPYAAHLTAVLNFSVVFFMQCGRQRSDVLNGIICAALLFLFISGMTSAAITYVFFTPFYVLACSLNMFSQPPSWRELAWKTAAIFICIVFFLSADLLNYYLGTVAAVKRTPASQVNWSALLSVSAWLEAIFSHPICKGDPAFLLCRENRGLWVQVAGVVGAAMCIKSRAAQIPYLAGLFIVFFPLSQLYAVAWQKGWLGPASVFSQHFLIWPTLTFVCIFATVAVLSPLWLLRLRWPLQIGQRDTGIMIALAAFATFCVLATVQHPYKIFGYHRAPQIAVMIAAGAFFYWVIAIRRSVQWRKVVVLAAIPILAVMFLLMSYRWPAAPEAKDYALRDYLRAETAVDPGKPFRGYVATIWTDEDGNMRKAGMSEATFNSGERYYHARAYFSAHFGEIFTTTDFWEQSIPTFEEYAEWITSAAQAFATRFLATPDINVWSNYLQAYTIKPQIMAALGVRFIVTDAKSVPNASLRISAKSLDARADVNVFELVNPNLGTYSPLQLVTVKSIDALAAAIENGAKLTDVAFVTADLPPVSSRAHDVRITVERGGVHITGESEGPAYLLVPIQFSHCLHIIGDTPAEIMRANLVQSLVSFSGHLDVSIQFRFGLFEHNACRVQDGRDMRAFGVM
jgi:hypothetical protein